VALISDKALYFARLQLRHAFVFKTGTRLLAVSGGILHQGDARSIRARFGAA
jgi:hypothetical protein